MAELLVTVLIQSALAIAASALINVLFPTRIEGPRLSDLRVQVSTYGNAIPLLLGQAVRVAGNVIWSSGLQEHSNTESAKGGPEITSYTYTVDCAVGLGERPNGIAGILKIWAFGKLIYDATAEAPSGTPQGDIPAGSFFLDILGNIGALETPFLQQALATQAVFESITVYPGNFTQNPDPTMEAALGVGNVPAYRGTAYVVLKGLQLADFGNVLPNLEFLVIPNPEATVRSEVEIIVDRAGVPSDRYEFGCLTDPQPGYVVGRVMTANAALAPLTLAHNFDIVDDAGTLRGILRDENVVAIISTDDLAGHAFGEERPDPLQWERSRVVDLPQEASITFFDPARDFQENSVAARRAAGSADSNIAIELAMTLDVDHARALADRALWEAWLASQMAKVQSTDRLIDMKVGLVYMFETPAGLEALRVFSKTRGRNGVIEFELRRERAELYSSPNLGTTGSGVPTQEIPVPGPSELVLLDIPLLRDADNNSGFYFAVAGSETGWRGAAVMRALNLSEDFITFRSAGVESVIGDVVNTLADGPTELSGSGGGFDEDNFIDVEVRHSGMTLESASDDALAGGANVAFIGRPYDTTEGEIIQFGDAQLLSGNTYRLSHLIRGKRGTEFATTRHVSDEIFVLLRANGSTMRADFGVNDLELERLYKAVSLLLNADDVDYTAFTNTGVGLRPYSPINLDVSGDTGGDLILSWDRRSRLDSGALGEQAEVYEVLIMDGSSVVREVNPTEPTWTYTLAMQTEDWGGAVDDLDWRVAQVSATYGNGVFATWTGPISGGSGT